MWNFGWRCKLNMCRERRSATVEDSSRGVPWGCIVVKQLDFVGWMDSCALLEPTPVEYLQMNSREVSQISCRDKCHFHDLPIKMKDLKLQIRNLS